MKKTAKNSARRLPYTKPALTVVEEKQLLELLGPAQSYGGGGKAMPLDTEWMRL